MSLNFPSHQLVYKSISMAPQHAQTAVHIKCGPGGSADLKTHCGTKVCIGTKAKTQRPCDVYNKNDSGSIFT